MAEPLNSRQRHQLAELDTADGHGTFLKRQWGGFAAYAWKHYLAEGRGAVVVDLRNASRSGSGINLPSFYVAEGSDRLAKLGGWPDPDVAQLIQDYDPEQDVVFLFLRLNGEIFYYNVADEPTPPQAYGKRR